MKRPYKIAILGGIVVAVLAFVVSGSRGGGQDVITDTVKTQDLTQTILASGSVTSSVDLDLAFKISGIVKRIPIKVGQKVNAGDVLIQLDQADQSAGIASARASVALNEANLKKVLAGASNEEVVVAQVAVTSAERSLEDTRRQQETLVKNAKAALYNTGLEAVRHINNISSTEVIVSGYYTGVDPVVYKVKVYTSGSGLRYSVSSARGLTGEVVVGSVLPATTDGLFISFTTNPASSYDYDSWTIEVPNPRASGYAAANNNYLAALETSKNAISTVQSTLESAQASLALKKAQARPADVSAAEAQVLSAKAQLSSALAQFESTLIRAPSNGTVTKIDIKVGEQATSLTPVVVLQDTENLYVEANISEASIARVKPEQAVMYTLDAFGADRKFVGKILNIEPASTLVSGVVNYKVTASVDGGLDIKPGMTANLRILLASKQAALAVPDRALVKKDGKAYVRVITDTKSKSYEEREVTLGLEADGGLIEIVDGLKAGQEFVVSLDAKK